MNKKNKRRSKMTKLSKIEGIGSVNEAKLKAAKAGSVEGLLKKGATAKGRAELATASGISKKFILEWVNSADLFRIKGVGGQYADLLEEAGVDTVIELANRAPEALHKIIMDVNVKKNLVNRPPNLKMVKNWIVQAKKLRRVVEY
jgi:predicted flap endonuclease-1-like 5' DNA nuclease